MLEYLLKRLSLALFTLLTILMVSYALLRMAPGDPTRSEIFGDGASAGTVSSENAALARNSAMREKLHLDDPVLVGFGLWLKQVVLHGDFGESAVVEPGRPVTDLILSRLPVTVKLNLLAILLTYGIAIPIGIGASLHPGGTGDRITGTVLFILYSLPVMWVGLLLQSLLCEGGVWACFPLKGLTPDQPERLSIWALQWETLRCYALPVFCLAYGGLAGLSRYARGSMLEVIQSDYVRTARAKGVPECSVVWHHAFRNALITLITLFGGILPSLVAGSVIVESIFNIPGMGNLSLLSLSSRDYPLQMALFSFAGALTLAGILLADLLYVAADPRIKLAGRG